MIVAVDLSTVAVLAAISLSEGIGRIPAGALVLRRPLLGPWSVAGKPGVPTRLQVVHWWPPLVETLVVPPPSGGLTPVTGEEFHQRLVATTWIRRAARTVGAVTLLGLVLGIPLGVEIAGWVGGLLAAAGVATGQIILAVLGWQGLRVLGATRRTRWRLVAVTLNPFAAPAVGSRILSAAATGVSPLAVAKILLKSDVWTSWFRPRAYDARMARALDDDLSRELQNADAIIDAVLRQPPPGVGDDHWCPRCAATYQAGFTTCAECDVPLEGGAAAASRNSKC